MHTSFRKEDTSLNASLPEKQSAAAMNTYYNTEFPPSTLVARIP